ncbi:MAG: hypothetical protein IH961_09585 [Chloroflexi bacterium]|nr:hypothetical protein [Chloroflexota bacterium]
MSHVSRPAAALRVLQRRHVKEGPGTLSNVAVGFSTTTSKDIVNKIVLQNRVFTLPDDPTLAFGGNATLNGASAIAFKWVVARSGGFGIRSASAVFSAFASFTASGVSALMMVPVTLTAGEIPIALLIRWSAGIMSTGRIINVGTQPNKVPNVGSWGL